MITIAAADIFNLAIKFLMLYIAGAASQEAFRKRLYPLGFLMLGIYLQCFKTAFLRATATYLGLFSKPSEYESVRNLMLFFQNPLMATVLDIILLLGLIMMFGVITKHIHKLYFKKGVTQ